MSGEALSLQLVGMPGHSIVVVVATEFFSAPVSFWARGLESDLCASATLSRPTRDHANHRRP